MPNDTTYDRCCDYDYSRDGAVGVERDAVVFKKELPKSVTKLKYAGNDR